MDEETEAEKEQSFTQDHTTSQWPRKNFKPDVNPKSFLYSHEGSLICLATSSLAQSHPSQH